MSWRQALGRPLPLLPTLVSKVTARPVLAGTDSPAAPTNKGAAVARQDAFEKVRFRPSGRPAPRLAPFVFFPFRRPEAKHLSLPIPVVYRQRHPASGRPDRMPYAAILGIP